jgi:hypothetical protein
VSYILPSILLAVHILLFHSPVDVESPSFRSHLNGGLIIVVPGRFYLLPAPAGDLPAGREWADDGPGGRRRFSAAFYADLLRDVGAAALVGLDGARCAIADAPSPSPSLHSRYREDAERFGPCH